MARAWPTWLLYAALAVTMVGGASWPRPSAAVVGAGVGLLLLGVFLKRRVDRAAGAEDDARSAAAASGGGGLPLRETLGAMREGVEALRVRSGEEAVALGALADDIEALRAKTVGPWVAAQEGLVRRRGFAAYAAVMGPLSTAERFMYRAWSAASDGHREECEASLAQAEPYIDDAIGAEGDALRE